MAEYQRAVYGGRIYTGQLYIPGKLERVEEVAGRVITVVRVYARDQSASFHVTSFMKLQDDKILELDEYWGDDGPPPRWRQSMHLGKPLKPSGNLPLLP